MKVGAFCDSVLRKLTSGVYSKTEYRIERRDVLNYLNDGIGAVVKANFWENYQLGNPGNIDPGFLTAYENIPVLFSASRGAYYSDLPVTPIAIERGMGMYEVFPSQDPSDTFIPMMPGSYGLFKGLAAEYLFGEKGAMQVGRRLWYKNINQAGDPITEVSGNILADASTLSMDDELPVPADYLAQLRTIVLGFITGEAFPDKQLNATPNAK